MVFNKKRILILGGIGFVGSFAFCAVMMVFNNAPIGGAIEITSATTAISIALGITIDLLRPLFNLININALKRPLAFLNQGEKKILRSKKLLDAGAITEQEYQKRVQKFRAGME